MYSNRLIGGEVVGTDWSVYFVCLYKNAYFGFILGSCDILWVSYDDMLNGSGHDFRTVW